MFVHLDHIAAFSRNPIRKMGLPNFVELCNDVCDKERDDYDYDHGNDTLAIRGSLSAVRASGSVRRDFVSAGGAIN